MKKAAQRPNSIVAGGSTINYTWSCHLTTKHWRAHSFGCQGHTNLGKKKAVNSDLLLACETLSMRQQSMTANTRSGQPTNKCLIETHVFTLRGPCRTFRKESSPFSSLVQMSFSASQSLPVKTRFTWGAAVSYCAI